MCRNRLIVLLAVTALGLIFPYRADGQTQVPTIDETLDALDFDAEEKKAFHAGRIVSKDLKEIMETELVAAVSMIMPVSLERVCKEVLGTPSAARGTNVIAHGVVTRPAKEADWEELAYAADETDEARLLTKAQPGKEFNLSEEEFEVLAAKLGDVKKGDANALTKVSAAYRSILLDRFRLYSKGGIEAIQPYARERNETTSPGAELVAAFKEAEPFLLRYFPDFAAALAGFPESAVAGISHRFSWLKRRLQDRPAFILLHETYTGDAHYCLLSERQYFVGHSYNSLSAITLMLPFDDSTAIFYVNSTRTDRITGFLGSVGRSVGQDRLRAALERHFAALLNQTND